MNQEHRDEGGFLLKFNGKEVQRCVSVSVDYDLWEYTVNAEAKKLPGDLKTVTVEVEHPE